MSNQRNVLRLRIPFSTHNNKLRNKPRPYVCMTNLPNLRLVKCQTVKISHRNNPNALPINRVIVHPSNETPFISPTIMDCDKVFDVLNVSFIDTALLMITPGKPSSVSVRVFDDIQRKLDRADLEIHKLSLNETSRFNNHKIR